MKRILFLTFWFYAVSIFVGLSQSRMPEIKIEEHPKVKTDIDSLEERPYFLLIDQSEKALKDGDYEAAALRLVEAMGVEPDNELNVALLSNLGMIYFYDEKDSLALVVLDKAIERAPKLIAPREGRARILVSLGRDDEAYKEYENIIGIDSINTNARFLHGMMALYKGELQTALSDVAVLENVIPASTTTLQARAILYSMTGCELEAISLFKKLIEKEPAPEYYGRLAACQIAIDRLGEASFTIGEWREKYPDDGEMFYYSALLNKKRYLLDDAQKDARNAIRLGADPRKVADIFKE